MIRSTITPIPTNTLYYNNQKYLVDISLLNPDGRVFPINTANLVNLQIIDDGLLWYKTGTLVIRNPDNIIERRPDGTVPIDANYVFRNDGRDIIAIKIAPIVDDHSNAELSPDSYNMEFVFAVYDKKDIVTGNTVRDKYLQLNFWELDYQIFSEINVDWSTNNLLPSNLIPSLLTDEEKKISTGLAIKNLIQFVLGEDSKFSTSWDTGASKIFYNSLANNNAIDDLEYLLYRHTSQKTGNQQEGDPCLLYRDRYTKTWFLQSFNNLFKLAVQQRSITGVLHRENFIIAGSSQSDDSIIPSFQQIPKSTDLKYFSNINSIITNYQFEDSSTNTNTNFFVNYPCYSNDLKNKTFKVDFVDNTVESVKNYIQKTYVDSLGVNATAALTLNKTKKDAKIVKQAYSFQRDKVARYADSRNLLLKSMLFLNQSLAFTVPGTTYRQANCFIGIDKNQNTIANNFDNKLLGQWYVNKIVHTFTDEKYTNTLYTVKLHTNDRMPISDDVG
jgi:hypothetical protein